MQLSSLHTPAKVRPALIFSAACLPSPLATPLLLPFPFPYPRVKNGELRVLRGLRGTAAAGVIAGEVWGVRCGVYGVGCEV